MLRNTTSAAQKEPVMKFISGMLTSFTLTSIAVLAALGAYAESHRAPDQP